MVEVRSATEHGTVAPGYGVDAMTNTPPRKLDWRSVRVPSVADVVSNLGADFLQHHAATERLLEGVASRESVRGWREFDSLPDGEPWASLEGYIVWMNHLRDGVASLRWGFYLAAYSMFERFVLIRTTWGRQPPSSKMPRITAVDAIKEHVAEQGERVLSDWDDFRNRVTDLQNLRHALSHGGGFYRDEDRQKIKRLIDEHEVTIEDDLWLRLADGFFGRAGDDLAQSLRVVDYLAGLRDAETK